MQPISIVILSHNRLADLSINVHNFLEKQNGICEFQIIIVDNASTDGTQDFLLLLNKQHPQIEIVLNENNLGVGGGRNTGFTQADRDYIVALDDDSRISIEDLRHIPDLFDKHPEAGILAFRVIHLASGEEQNPHGNQMCEIANHHGAGFAFRRSVYESIGGIDEECNFGAEELDFAIRTYDQGWKILYTPEITVYHNNFKRKSGLDQFRRTRRVYNNVRIYCKYFPVWMATRNSTRYFLLAIRTWISSYGLSDIQDLFGAFFQGYIAGMSNRKLVSTKTRRYYNNPNLRPEFGNVPLFYKIFNIQGARHQK